ncbi:MAG: hypothetical protein BGN96_11455 [Bacteroidales bacterium 45-6]|nr:MAG: hypothetical protein BGN96_11455 [Bacteroidales bacterium 45-6]
MKTTFPKLIILLTIIASTTAVPSYSQNFSGKIVGQADNQPVVGATILIRETKQGVACNESGEFQAKLQPGAYHVDYRCLGYETLSETVNISREEKVYRKIQLKAKDFNLKEVVVSNKEDPAYEIMRKTIAKAPFYQKIVKEYEAECYIKGNMELTKVNKMLDKLSGNDDGVKASEYKDKLFVQESFSTIKFTAPDRYEQTVKAFKSSIPDNKSPKETMGVVIGSLYLPRFLGCISPLHPKAFGYYKFRYEGFTDENGDNVNKIKVIPKLKDPELFSGYIYIADNSWDIRNADLTSSVYGIDQHFVITYGKLSEAVYLPTAFTNYLTANILGYGGNFSYHSSIKYTHLMVNDSIRNEIKPLPTKRKKNLNLSLLSDRYKRTADTLATKRDSAYWKDIRNVPLSQKEIESFAKKDSVQSHLDSLRKKKTDAKFESSDIIMGGQIGGDSTKWTFNYGGVIGALRDYNFVDGFELGQKLSVTRKLGKQNKLLVAPDIYYTTARKSLAWKTDIALSYAPMCIGMLAVSFGDVATDFNPEGPTRLNNAYTSFIYQKNTVMFYRKKYAEIGNQIDMANGLKLSTGLAFARRSPLENNTTFALFKREKNVTENLQSPEFSDLAAYSIGLEYTPEYYYTVSNGRKEYQHSRFPTLKLRYAEGFSSIWSHNAHFRKLDAYLTHQVQTSLFSSIRYELNGGAFLGNTDWMNFADYKFFDTSGDFWLTQKSPFTTFMLLDPYTSATNDYWFSSKIGYRSKYIVLKHLPFMQGKLFNESLQLKYLYTPNRKNYVEAGYYVDFFKLMNIGVSISFDKMKYDSWGIRIAVPLNLKNGKIEVR